MDHPHLQADIDFIVEIGHGSFQRGLLKAIGAARSMNELERLDLLDEDLSVLADLGAGSVATGMRISMRAARLLGPGLTQAASAQALAAHEIEALSRIGNGDALAGLRLCLNATMTLGPEVARKLAGGN